MKFTHLMTSFNFFYKKYIILGFCSFVIPETLEEYSNSYYGFLQMLIPMIVAISQWLTFG